MITCTDGISAAALAEAAKLDILENRKDFVFRYKICPDCAVATKYDTILSAASGILWLYRVCPQCHLDWWRADG